MAPRARTNGPLTTRAGARAFRALMRRADARAAAAVAEPDDFARAVGGAVRDAFLGRRGGDLDIVVASGRAETFAARLAASTGSRVVLLGEVPTRVIKIAFAGRTMDIWEETVDQEQDLLRRDFTVNTLSFALPDGTYTSAPGALADLNSGRLAPPREGVFLEDPLRVLRGARFLAELETFHIARTAIPEMRSAGRLLGIVAAERRLVELDKLLGAPAAGRLRGLRFLERIGALQILLPGTAARERRRGLSLVGRLRGLDPRIARALLLLPVGQHRALDFLKGWKISRDEQRLASRLFSQQLRAPRRSHTRRDVAALLRFSFPFEAESTEFLLVAGDSSAKELAHAARSTLQRPAALRQILKPTRPLPSAELSSLLGLPDGPALGKALDAFDLALASGEIRGMRAARAWLSARR